MKSNILRSFFVLFILFVLVSVIGCSAGSDSAPEGKSWNNEQTDGYQDSNKYSVKAGSVNESETSIQYSKSYDTENEQQNAATSDTSTALTGTGEPNNPVNNPILNERKIIRNANLSVEVDNFDKAYGKIEYIISGIGYVQESKINKVKHYVNDKEVLVTNGVIIIRVDADKFTTVLKDIKGLGLLTEENIKTDDVTEKFFDVESRLRLLRYEESRLEEYLKKIEDPDTIFKTESRLTDIRHEIEGLTGTLIKLGDLVKLSTITINMNEKPPESVLSATRTDESYLIKLKDNFLGSLSGVVEFLGNLLIFLAAAFPVLALLGILFFAVYFIYRKLLKGRIKIVKQAPPQQDNNLES